MVISFIGLNLGSFSFTPMQVLKIIGGGDLPNREIIIDLRMPRVLLALLAGGILTLGGFFMQAIIKNPLADPYIMGMSAGAGLGVNIAILGGFSFGIGSYLGIPIAAALGAFLSLALVLLLGFRVLNEDSARLLIAGVAVASVLTALTALLIYKFADNDQLAQLVYWSFGSFGRADWEAVKLAGLLLLGALVGAWILGTRLDLLMLGDVQAAGLGMQTGKVKVIILVICSFSVGGLVAFTGPIGFVGMMVPHFARSFFGAIHRRNLLPSCLLGACFMEACDILARILTPPAGLPIGIITSLLGVPFFLYLLFSSKSYL